MKRILYSNHILWALSLMALFSCQSETLERTEGASVPLEIRTAAHSTLTRTTLGPDGRSVIWTEGDDIAVFDNVAPKHMFTASIADGIARFQGNITPKTTDFLAVYPYELASENLLGGHIVVNLPSTQTASLNTFSTGLNVSVAKGSRNVDGSPSYVSFINVCQVFKFTVPAYAKDQITSIQLQADVVLAGQMNIDYSDYNPVVSTSEQGSKAITILPPNGSSTFAEGTYCIVTAPATLNGFTFLLTAGGKTYRQHSSSAIGGASSVIADLRTLDLIDTPQVTAQHVYTNNVLQGTALSITAPTPDKQWSATVKNAEGTVVRTFVAGTGTLQSDENDSEWPYLPVGNYTVDYSYTTSNGKTMQAQTSFSITEQPRFSLAFQAASSYSYYLGDGVAKNVETANSMNAYAVTGIVATVSGIAPKLLNDSKYAGTLSNTFSGSVASSTDGTITFNDLTLTTLGENTLQASYTFQGITQTASKTVYITGLPFRSEPPTSDLWSKSGTGSFNDGYVELGHNSSPSSQSTEIVYEHVSIPAGTKVMLDHSEYIHRFTVGTTYTIYFGDETVTSANISGGFGSDDKNFEEYLAYTTKGLVTRVRCRNSYGESMTYTQVYKIAVTYGE